MNRTGLIALLLLAGCNAPEDTTTPVAAPAAEVETPQAPAPAGAQLTAQGFGPLRIGMTRAEVEAALGPDSNPEAVGGPEPESCDIFHPQNAPDGLKVMVENNVLTSVWLDPGSPVTTDRGVRMGASAAEVRAAYRGGLEATPHKYEDAPAEYLFVWSSADRSSPAARGIKYEIGDDGKLQRIAGGGPSIQYVEGCL